METRLIDPLRDASWNQLVLAHPRSNFFHGAAWARVLTRTYRHKPFYLQCFAQNQSAALVPIMELRSPWTGCRGVSLPFSDCCAPLVDRGDPNFLFQALRQLAQERGWKHLQFRGGNPFQPEATPSTAFYGHYLQLGKPVDGLFASFESSVRRSVRKAEAGELGVHLSRTWSGVASFYRLHLRTRRRHGTPPQSLSFFRNIYEEIIAADLGFVVIATRGKTPVAAAVFFRLGDKAIYKFGASDERFQHLRGNNLVMWTAIKHLAGSGCGLLHFGRTSRDNEGLRRFKLGWGAEEEVIEYFQYDTRLGQWVENRDHPSTVPKALFRKLPMALNRLTGTMLYPHLD